MSKQGICMLSVTHIAITYHIVNDISLCIIIVLCVTIIFYHFTSDLQIRPWSEVRSHFVRQPSRVVPAHVGQSEWLCFDGTHMPTSPLILNLDTPPLTCVPNRTVINLYVVAWRLHCFCCFRFSFTILCPVRPQPSRSLEVTLTIALAEIWFILPQGR